MKLTFLGTGHAMVTRCYNTCFALHEGKDIFLTDAGGGNGILAQLKSAGLEAQNISHFFVTHAHTDHLLGAVWILRQAAALMADGRRTRALKVYGHDAVLYALQTICRLTLPPKLLAFFGKEIEFVEAKHLQTENILDCRITFFDIASTKTKQFGFRAELPDAKILACLGDEPCASSSKDLVRAADWLLSEAFCLLADKEIFRPYEKHHSTAADAGKLAAELGVKNLVLYHTEDTRLPHRKKLYALEAGLYFNGSIFVPDDLQTLEI